MTTALKRYSKPRGAGDQTSGGRGKLLRAHGELTRVQILVRETIQNAWDAADDEWIPAYGVHIRAAAVEVTSCLREQVFTSLGPELQDLRESLKADDLHLIEIYDRGTTGLNGPVSADQAAPEGSPNNFNAFVFDIGSTKPLGQSGGTFGFGKTATFEVSAPHAVVYWTRCDRGDGELEDRLIACALHEPYDVSARRFTGAHWWGELEQDAILPLRGAEATRLAQNLFETHFGPEETGTSILVIDPMVTVSSASQIAERVPVRDQESAAELGRQMLEAILTSAWPKLVPYATGDTPMIIKLDVCGAEVDVAAMVEERFQVLGHGLSQIRAAQGGEDFAGSWARPAEILEESLLDVSLRPALTADRPREAYFGSRSDNVVGHLYLAKALRDPLQDTIKGRHVNEYCFMRSEAELVVWYEPLADDDQSLFTWFSLFKPTPECDVHFAASEPSTHDSWNKNAPDDPASTYVVERALAHVRRQARKFMSASEATPVSERRSARHLAASLQGFLPHGSPDGGAGGSEPSVAGGQLGETTATETGSSGGPRRKGRGSLGDLVSVTSAEVDATGLWTLTFVLGGEAGHTHHLEARVAARTAEGALVLDEDELSVGWEAEALSATGSQFAVQGGSHGVIRIRPLIDASISVELNVVGVS